MKTVTFKLTLEVEIDPQGETIPDMRKRIMNVVRNTMNNGTLTGDSLSTIERYNYEVEVVK